MVELYRVEGSLAGLSMLGSGAIILTYFLMRDLRKHPTSLVFWLSFCDFFFSLKFFITAVWKNSTSIQDHPVACLLQAISAQFFGLGSISWNAMISVNLIITLRNPFANTAGLAKFYHLFVWTLAASTTFIMAVTHSYDSSGDGTCWISNTRMRLMFFAPLLIYFAISLSTLLVAAVRIKNIQMETANDADRKKLMFRMSLYVAAFIVFWTGPVIHRAVQYWDMDSDAANSKFLLYLDAVGVSAQGFANGIVWLTNSSFYIPFKQKILLRVMHLLGRDSEKVPLLPRQLEENFQDSNLDIQRMDIHLRKYMITCILLGTRNAVQIMEYLHDYVCRLTPLLPIRRTDLPEKRKTSKKEEAEEEQETEREKFNPGFKFIDYAPLVFMKLREIANISKDEYLNSLEPKKFLHNLQNQKFSEGRSGSFFVFSPDKKFIMKTIPESEAVLLLKILPHFYRYLEQNPESLIIRFYGLHAIKMPAGEVVYVTIMENVFNTSLRIHEKYDLKGSWVNRKVGKAHEENPGILGMDEDLKRMGRKMELPPALREKFLIQVEKDSKFFANLNIMDYSLLIGFHFVDFDKEDFVIDTEKEEKKEEIVEDSNETRFNRKYKGGMLSADGKVVYLTGIIDILQLYDAKKKREHCFKVYILQKNRHGISAQPPNYYSERFIDAMQHLCS